MASENWDIPTEEIHLKVGRILSDPAPEDAVVITGMSGIFPNSANIDEFKENLFSKKQMVTLNTRPGFNNPELARDSGLIPRTNDYDPGHFGTHWRLANHSDPVNRISLEIVYEALLDAGVNPTDIANTNTGIFFARCFSESEGALRTNPVAQFSFYGIMACSTPVRLAYFFKTKGPAYNVDTACSSSMHAFEVAFREIRLGHCDAAIVIGANTCLNVGTTVQFKRLGVLSPDGRCKTFDEKGNGYVRSEAIAAVFLQKAKDAKRIYAQIINSKANSDGYKEQGITYPSGKDQAQLLKEIYTESNIKPEDLSFLEAHGTGTIVGDPEEVNSFDEFFCKNRKTPLPIGSIKSNLGHTEPTSGLCSLVKVIFAMESGKVAPNINFNVPNPTIKGIIEGRMKVVTETLEMTEDHPLIGVNSFGFGGSNAHAILKGIMKKSPIVQPTDDLPRIVFVSGRTEEAVVTLLNDLGHRRPLNVDHIRLLQSCFSKYIDTHHNRGYTIISKSGEIHRAVYVVDTLKILPLYLLFGELDSWETNYTEFSNVPCFQNTLQRVNKFLTSKKLSLINTILNPKKEVRKEFNVLGSIIVQIGIANILKTLKLNVASVLGYSYGELICAYYDNILTLDEVLECALMLNSQLDVNSTEQMNGHAGHSSNYKQIQYNSSTARNGLIKKLMTILNTPRTWTNGSMKKKIASAEYFTDAILYKTEKLEKELKYNSLVFEIGSSSLEAVNNLEDIATFRFHNFQGFLEILGSLYFHGHLSSIDQLYPKVEFPVKRGTPEISSKIRWNHSRKWWVINDEGDDTEAKVLCQSYLISPTISAWKFLNGHVIDGRNLFPASGYLYLIWITYIDRGLKSEYSIIFEDCRFLRATTLNNIGVDFNVQISNSGYFEIMEGGAIVMTGKVTVKFNENIKLVPTGKRDDASEVMSQKDVYKELRLRGYNYKGDFRGIQATSLDGTNGIIKFTDNWIAFLDNLFQLKILSQDSRGLFVPTSIDYIKIDNSKHIEYVAHQPKLNEGVNCEAFYYKEVDCIRCGGVEIKGLNASQIQRKKNLGIPVLESYDFIPNNTKLSYKDSVRVNTQILLENTLLQKIKTIELIDSETVDDPQILSEVVIESFQDQPLIQPNSRILSKMQLETTVEVDNKDLCDETDCALIIGSRLIKQPQVLLEATKALKDNGYIISREPLDFSSKTLAHNDLIVLTMHNTGTEILVLLGKVEKKKPPTYIEISNDPEFEWLPEVQTAMQSNEVVVYSHNNPTSGLLGFTNCLKREPGYNNVRCVLILDENINFDPNSEMFVDQLKKNLSINVYKDGQWGTYRHILLKQNNEVHHNHYFAKETLRGDLSKIKFVEGTLRKDMKTDVDRTLVDIYYSSVNFKDIMVATGKIQLAESRLEEEKTLGFEYAGIDEKGRRVMGFWPAGISNLALVNSSFLFTVPDEWSLKSAASVTSVYMTVITAFFARGQLKKGESVLIHSGTGGIGLAAIHFCLHHGCNVFTTCGSIAKKQYLLKKFPQLKESQIGNSRDISFEKMVKRETNGRGVDLVLNSLSDEKLIASVKCLAKGGRFLEIGKFDLSNNTQLNLLFLEREASFHGIHLDQLINAPVWRCQESFNLVKKCIAEGYVKPLDVNIFPSNELEQAFRFMASGKHMGKVVIEIKPEDAPPKYQLTSLPRFYCNPEKSYIILGGLGGFGVELADWFLIRGAMNLVLVSRSGTKNGYQKSRIQRWTQDYGYNVKISTANVSTRDGCEQLIREANELAPVGGIFNLAVVLQDAVFENQTAGMYKTSLTPKAYSTKYLDEITRKSCPQLDYFVVFSSVSCGRGNAGQTNYGMANSIMERICERRRKDGLPALAIQWGAIGEVGLVAEMQEDHRELEIGGTLQQRLSSCIEVMDVLFAQKSSAIVSSIVVAEKKNSGGAENVSGEIAIILGIDLKTVQDSQTLAELGMDSMTAIEIKQLLDREYGIFLTAKEIRTLTFARIKELDNEAKIEALVGVNESEGDLILSKAVRLIIESANMEQRTLKLNSNVSDDADAPTIIIFPGIEGFSNVLMPLATKLNAHVIACHYDFKNPKLTLPDMAQTEVDFIESKFDKNETIHFLAHSYGTLVALEAVSQLEKKGYNKITVICCDGSPEFLYTIVNGFPNQESDFDTEILTRCIDSVVTKEELAKFTEDVSQLPLDKKIEKSIEITSTVKKGFTDEEVVILYNGLLLRLKAVKNFQPKYSLEAKVVLCRASVDTLKGFPRDFGLEQTCGRSVEIIEIEGDHVSILEKDKLAETINSLIQK